jgi:gamma-polyglutamate biosynthesis protein CapA
MSKSVKILIAFLLLLVLGLIAALVSINGRTDQAAFFESPSYSEEETKEPETVLFFAGDVMLSRNVGSKITAAKDPMLPFLNVLDIIQGADISFANLESPFFNIGQRVTQGLVFKAEPEHIEGLKRSGFDLLSTANNHSLDQGQKGLLYTIELLKEHGIVLVGTGADCHDGAIIEKNGIKFGFLAYTYAGFNDGGRLMHPLVCDLNDLKQIESDIKSLKERADIVVVSSHMGSEYRRTPREEDSLKARAMIDHGADMIIGHHPHWIQTIEEYDGKWIFYSLGNFVFDQMWSIETREGLALLATFQGKRLSKIELRPVIIDNYCCPRWANETESADILQKIGLSRSVILPQQ